MDNYNKICMIIRKTDLLNHDEKDELQLYLMNLKDQVKKQKEVIENIQNFIKEFHKNRDMFKWNEQDYIDVILELEKIANEKEVSE